MIAAMIRRIFAEPVQPLDWTAKYQPRTRRPCSVDDSDERRTRRERPAAQHSRSWCRAGWEI